MLVGVILTGTFRDILDLWMFLKVLLLLKLLSKRNIAV
jgi:hypothetical protein